jgi:hypothetical protein
MMITTANGERRPGRSSCPPRLAATRVPSVRSTLAAPASRHGAAGRPAKQRGTLKSPLLPAGAYTQLGYPDKPLRKILRCGRRPPAGQQAARFGPCAAQPGSHSAPQPARLRLPCCSHHFEAAKAKQNEQCQERQMAAPSGQRWQVQTSYREQVEQRIKRDEARLEQVGGGAVSWAAAAAGAGAAGWAPRSAAATGESQTASEGLLEAEAGAWQAAAALVLAEQQQRRRSAAAGGGGRLR